MWLNYLCSSWWLSCPPGLTASPSSPFVNISARADGSFWKLFASGLLRFTSLWGKFSYASSPSLGMGIISCWLTGPLEISLLDINRKLIIHQTQLTILCSLRYAPNVNIITNSKTSQNTHPLNSPPSLHGFDLALNHFAGGGWELPACYTGSVVICRRVLRKSGSVTLLLATDTTHWVFINKLWTRTDTDWLECGLYTTHHRPPSTHYQRLLWTRCDMVNKPNSIVC